MVAAAEVVHKAYPVQGKFIADDARYVAFVAGRNSGKTFAGSVKAYRNAQRGGLGVIAAPDFPMLEFGAKRAFIERLRECREPFELHQQRGVVTIPRWNAEIRFATLETEGRVRGPNYAWGWVDEVEYVTDRTIWQALKGAIRDGSDPQLFVTTTPKGRRLVWDEWVQHATPNHVLYKATTRDNPFIDAEDYIAGLGYSGRFLAQEIDAEFVAFDGLVFPEWSRERLQAVDCDGWRCVLGVDVGTRNPTAILTVRQAGDGRVHVEREVYRRNMGAADVVAAIQSEADRVNPEAIYIDPSAAGYVVDLERAGYPVVKADNDRKRGVQLMATALADGLTVDPSCVAFVDEIEAWHYPDGKRESDDPVKENDHAMDAWRYAVVGLAGSATPGIW
jgi:phage terminase large subunit-like protein